MTNNSDSQRRDALAKAIKCWHRLTEDDQKNILDFCTEFVVLSLGKPQGNRAELIDWLEAKYRRHGEIEDQQAADMLRADLQQQEPVAWEWRAFDTHPQTVTSGQWSEWKRVEPHNIYMSTVQDRVNEIQRYIDDGYRYELRALYTAPPLQSQEPDHTYAIEELTKFNAKHDFLKWNRAQYDPFVKIPYEYAVYDKAVELYIEAMSKIEENNK